MKQSFEMFSSDFAACQDPGTELGAKFFSALRSSNFNDYAFESCLDAMKSVYPGKYDGLTLTEEVCELICSWMNSIVIYANE